MLTSFCGLNAKECATDLLAASPTEITTGLSFASVRERFGRCNIPVTSPDTCCSSSPKTDRPTPPVAIAPYALVYSSTCLYASSNHRWRKTGSRRKPRAPLAMCKIRQGTRIDAHHDLHTRNKPLVHYETRRQRRIQPSETQLC